MKKSELIKKVLKESCSLVNEDQVLQNMEILEKYGIIDYKWDLEKEDKKKKKSTDTCGFCSESCEFEWCIKNEEDNMIIGISIFYDVVLNEIVLFDYDDIKRKHCSHYSNGAICNYYGMTKDTLLFYSKSRDNYYKYIGELL